MALDNRTTYLCYNNRDLIRDGVIPPSIIKLYRGNPVSNFNFDRLRYPPKGVSYTIVRSPSDSSTIIEVREKKKLLPAEKMKIEIDFSKTMKNAVTHLFSPGSAMFGVVGGLVGNLGLGLIGLGGITSSLTEMTYHILESQTKINQKVQITQEILDTSIIQFDGFPLSVFGIVKEYIEDFGDNKEAAITYKEDHPQAQISVDSSGHTIAKIGLDFSNEQLDSLGKFSQGSFDGFGKKRIDGATDSNGLFGGKANPYLRIVENLGESGFDFEREVVLFEGQKQLFIKIVDDDRTLKFRGDNADALGGGVYPFKINGTTGIDVTDKKIRIDTTDLVVGDTIYITFNVTVGERHLRQNVEHKGSIAQGNTIGIIGFVGAIASEQDIFDYRIRKWKVPALPDGVTMSNIDNITDNYDKDEDYKLTIDEFIDIDTIQRQAEASGEEFILSESQASEIEGWRLSEAILWRRVKNLFAADYRGILYITYYSNLGGLGISVIYPRSQIRDQEWFTTYLENLDFTYPTGPPDPNNPVDEQGNPKLTYLPSDLEKKIENEIDFEDMEGFLFDISEIVNSLLFDREKIHYYRPFANALKKVSSYNINDNTTGIGIPHLDLLPLICPSIFSDVSTEVINGETITRKQNYFDQFNINGCRHINLEYYDLSYGDFDHVNLTYAKNQSCADSFSAQSSNYFSMNYNEDENKSQIWYDIGYIENNIFEWRPDGGTLNSFWKLETPYFCSDFNNSARVYIEKMGGNSLDNYSWIYVDSDPLVPNNISADSNANISSSILVFGESNVNDGLSYHKLYDNFFESQFPLVKIDKTRNHIKKTYEHIINGQNVVEAYDHNQDMVIGQNGILGDISSYSHGIPITEEIFRICGIVCDQDTPESFIFWFSKDLFNDTQPNGSSFGLNFSDTPPRLDIPFNWYIRYVEIQFSYTIETVKEIEKYVSFYFENSESSISNFLITETNEIDNIFTVRIWFKYYFGGPLQFLGNFWNKVNIISAKGRFVKGNDVSLDDVFNLDTYKIKTEQSAVTYDRRGRILVFYSNVSTGNIDVAVSYDDGNIWVYDRNIIRLVKGETASLPFVIKGNINSPIHLFYVLNDKFLMYRQIDTELLDMDNGLVEYNVPDSYSVGDYDIILEDPESLIWGAYSDRGRVLRRSPSYFIAGSAEDEYFLQQTSISQQIIDFNNQLTISLNANQIQTPRFLFNGETSEMRDDFRTSSYSVFESDEGFLKLFFVNNNKLTIKSSNSPTFWKYDIIDQLIHKNYMKEELNKGFSGDILNIQVVRNDYDKSFASLLYFNNEMLFIRHFNTNELISWYDSDGNLQDQQIRAHLEIVDNDPTTDPPIIRTNNLPIFLVGNIPESIKETIKSDIDNNIPIEESELAFIFPYKDPDNPSDINANKEMVDRFNENFKVDTNTQVSAFVTQQGLIRIFYKDNFNNINGIIIDGLRNPTLEVMNIFNGV